MTTAAEAIEVTATDLAGNVVGADAIEVTATP